MDNINTENKIEKNIPHGMIHIILFNTYFMFLIALILGVIFDQIFTFNYFSNNNFHYLDIQLVGDCSYLHNRLLSGLKNILKVTAIRMSILSQIINLKRVNGDK